MHALITDLEDTLARNSFNSLRDRPELAAQRFRSAGGNENSFRIGKPADSRSELRRDRRKNEPELDSAPSRLDQLITQALNRRALIRIDDKNLVFAVQDSADTAASKEQVQLLVE
jgi:hypothetical protein